MNFTNKYLLGLNIENIYEILEIFFSDVQVYFIYNFFTSSFEYDFYKKIVELEILIIVINFLLVFAFIHQFGRIESLNQGTGIYFLFTICI